jgi:hypothetical protein
MLGKDPPSKFGLRFSSHLPPRLAFGAHQSTRRQLAEFQLIFSQPHARAVRRRREYVQLIESLGDRNGDSKHPAEPQLAKPRIRKAHRRSTQLKRRQTSFREGSANLSAPRPMVVRLLAGTLFGRGRLSTSDVRYSPARPHFGVGADRPAQAVGSYVVEILSSRKTAAIRDRRCLRTTIPQTRASGLRPCRA